jgi:glycosyltransferase involved in cell wall biosynthesis
MLHNLLLTKISLAMLTRCALVIAPSNWQRKRLVTDGVPEEKVVAIPPPIRQPPAGHRKRPSNGTVPIVLIVARLFGFKGVGHALRASARVRYRHSLWIAGDGPAMPDLRRLASELGIEDGTRFLGAVEPSDLESVWDRASLVVVPSLVPETFGMVGPEAMARGIPVVAYGQAGVLDWLESQSQGRAARERYSVRPHDVGGLASAIEDALRRGAPATNGGTAARALAAALAPAQHAAALHSVYLDAIAGRAPDDGVADDLRVFALAE